MWSALENIALRESLPTPLEAGQSIHGILIAGQLSQGRHNLYHLGRRRSKPYILKQFYSLDTNAFLRWQNEARFIDIPQQPGFIWPIEEWRGGLILPFPRGIPLNDWVEQDGQSPEDRLFIASQLGNHLAQLHAAGMAHRSLSPSCVFIADNEVEINRFGSAHSIQWDDLWADSPLSACDPAYASPEMLGGIECGCAEDVYAFGAILHLLFSKRAAFGALKLLLRPMFPKYITPDGFPPGVEIPNEVNKLVSTCLAPVDSRPSMPQVTAVLNRFSRQEQERLQNFIIPASSATSTNKKKVMVFINDDERAAPLFDTAIRNGQEAPSVFLFVGLIPNNLPSGHAERFKSNLFKKLRQGLMRCRAAKLLWSVRVLENIDPEKTALNLVRQYHPDQILLGKRKHSRKGIPLRRGFQEELTTENIQMDFIS